MDQSDIKKISVVMCTYNGEKYLREQIDSILNQTYPIYEIIIQDDCSTDNTWNILEDYALTNSVFRIFRNEKNLSVYLNFFSAFQKAKGEWIAISDQDDVWFPEKIETYVYHTKGCDALLLYSDSIITDSNLNIIGKLEQPKVLSINDVVFHGKGIYGHSFFFRTELILTIRNWEEVILAYDHVLTIAALINNGTEHISSPLTFWRRHQSTVTKYSESNNFRPNKKNPVILAYSVLISLALGNSVPNFSWYYENFSKVLYNYKSNCSVDHYYRFTHYYAKESISGILQASWIWGSTTRGFYPKLKAMYQPFHYYYQCMTIYYETYRTWH